MADEIDTTGQPVTDMVKRCQTALIQSFGPHGVWDRAMLARMTERVIAEMREPTQAMLEAAGVAIFTENGEEWDAAPSSAKSLVTQMADTHWRAMIDATLGR